MLAFFDCQVGCLATTSDIDFDALLGAHATVTLVTRQGERPFDGIISQARWLGTGDMCHQTLAQPEWRQKPHICG